MTNCPLFILLAYDSLFHSSDSTHLHRRQTCTGRQMHLMGHMEHGNKSRRHFYGDHKSGLWPHSVWKHTRMQFIVLWGIIVKKELSSLGMSNVKFFLESFDVWISYVSARHVKRQTIRWMPTREKGFFLINRAKSGKQWPDMSEETPIVCLLPKHGFFSLCSEIDSWAVFCAKSEEHTGWRQLDKSCCLMNPVN